MPRSLAVTVMDSAIHGSSSMSLQVGRTRAAARSGAFEETSEQPMTSKAKSPGASSRRRIGRAAWTTTAFGARGGTLAA